MKLPRSKITRTIGSASTISPSVAGTFKVSISATAEARVERIRGASAVAASRDIAGVVAVAIDTPKRPIGKYINRKA